MIASAYQEAARQIPLRVTSRSHVDQLESQVGTMIQRGHLYPQLSAGGNRKPNRTGRTEPNRITNSGTGRNRTRKRSEPNRTEPRHVRKTQAEPHRTGENIFPNRTEPMDFQQVRNRNESNQFLTVSYDYVCICIVCNYICI